jgi:hypothetical protein
MVQRWRFLCDAKMLRALEHLLDYWQWNCQVSRNLAIPLLETRWFPAALLRNIYKNCDPYIRDESNDRKLNKITFYNKINKRKPKKKELQNNQ